MKRLRFVCVLTIGMALGTGSQVAHAEPQDPSAARVLFRKGRSAAQAGDFATACPSFAESYRLDPAVGTLLNLADCEEKLGRTATAWIDFQKGLDRLPPNDERRSMVEQRIAGLDQRVPRLTLRLAATAPADMIVERDGVALGRSTFGEPLPVDPGKHLVIAKTASAGERRFEVQLAEGANQELVVEPPQSPIQGPATEPTPMPASTADRPTVQTAPPPSNTTRNLGIAALGIGAAGIVLGTATRIAAFGKQSTLDAECDATGGCTDRGMDAVSSARTLQTLSTTSFIVGAVGLGAGAYLLLASPRRAAPVATIETRWLPGGAGLAVRGRF